MEHFGVINLYMLVVHFIIIMLKLRDINLLMML